jgi:hypothetical protein
MAYSRTLLEVEKFPEGSPWSLGNYLRRLLLLSIADDAN